MSQSSEARAIVACACNEHKNSDLRADNKDIIAAFDERLEELKATNRNLRLRIHNLERHNQYFERCESSWCNPSSDPVEFSKLPQGDRAKVERIAELEASLQFAQLERDNRTAAYEVGVKRIGELRRDKDLLDWLQERVVDTIYLDDGQIIDVRGGDLRKAIVAKREALAGKG